MSGNIRRHADSLRKLCKCRKSLQRGNIVREGGNDLLKTISNIALNAQKGNIKYRPAALTKLKRHKTAIHALANNRIPLHQKRKIVVQQGGFLPLLLAPLVGGLLSNLFAR